MKTQIKNDVLDFNKSSLVELNDQLINETNSGFLPLIIASSGGCAILAAEASSGFCGGLAIGAATYVAMQL